jgi:hypothetical protein
LGEGVINAVLVNLGQGDPGPNVQLFGVPDRPVFFQECEKILQDSLGVSGHRRILRLEAATDRIGNGSLETQVSSR